MILSFTTACSVFKMKSLAFTIHVRGHEKEFHLWVHLDLWVKIFVGVFHSYHIILSIWKFVYVTCDFRKIWCKKMYCSFTEIHKIVWLRKNINNNWEINAYKRQFFEVNFQMWWELLYLTIFFMCYFGID